MLVGVQVTDLDGVVKLVEGRNANTLVPLFGIGIFFRDVGNGFGGFPVRAFLSAFALLSRIMSAL